MKLSKRLAAVAEYIPTNGRMADIGTDHAHLPIWLIKNKKCTECLACDVADGPLMRAKENIETEGMADKIKTVKTYGVCGLEDLADCFVIAGMGGDLICDIISKSDFLKNKEITLVLQPMTKCERLRYFLFSEGFEINDEKVVFEDNKYYNVMYVTYSAKKYLPEPFEAYVGTKKLFFSTNADVLRNFLDEKIKVLNKIISGKKSAGNSANVEKDILKKLEALKAEGKL